MISLERALRLRLDGLRWHPRSGDRFAVLQPELDAEVFTISEMTIQAHDYPTGTVLGFNGTTEWALDSVAQDDAVWLPREDQLRELLGGTFRSLARAVDGTYQVVVEAPGRPERSFTADTAEDAYADALVELVALALDRLP
ncbi:pilus assembly protein CpaE [Cellulomonas soli]|uniref:Pilus assembly protein CpaE n=1 Tax=Cellulomonas soli TaxID=931535 RepID=A0A512PIF6_9CELL|nr:pilus assembly protein CpaE [Cellulomonas soli]NYI59953.1 hypothetical protein [Cellulomonas soli]GEP70976.1 hypothetical protein CSO01_36910 [Cellulomonas soli]